MPLVKINISKKKIKKVLTNTDTRDKIYKSLARECLWQRTLGL